MASTAINQPQAGPLGLSTPLDPLGLAPIPEDTRRRFLRFKLAREDKVLLPLETVVEVRQLESAEILPVPEVPAHLLGVYSWRGEIHWLVDLNALVGELPLWQQQPFLEQAMVLMVESGERRVALVVEQVNDLEMLAPETIQVPTELYSTALSSFVIGYLPRHGGTVLDVDVIVERSLHSTA